jgi:hypothetical protein
MLKCAHMGACPLVLPDVPPRLPPDAWAHGRRRQYDAQACTRGTRSRGCRASSRTRRRMVPMPGPVGERDRGGASWCWAVWSRKRARALRLWSSEVRRARATARVWGTAGASHRSATPSRVAGSALVWPIAGRVDWRWVCGTGARRAARVRRRCGRRRRPARVARISAG